MIKAPAALSFDTSSSSSLMDLKDQNVPNEISFQYVCDDITSQRYVCQLRMAKSYNRAHYLDDQETEQHDSSSSSINILPATNKISFNNCSFSNNNKQQVDINNNNIIKPMSYASYGNGGALKRGCDDVDGETEDDLVTTLSTSSSSSMNSGRRSPPKKPKFIVTYKEMREFFTLLNEESIREFLKRDTCCLISDKYALAMVFTYFKRAKFYLNEYTRINFYLALYLASDIEEDIDEYKYEIFPWALGGRWRSKFSGFLRKRDALLRRIGYRAIVSRKCCDEVMSLVPDHYAWSRERAEDHGGATRAYLISRSRRHLALRANMEEEEMTLPRGPMEKARPCPLCLVNAPLNADRSSSPSSKRVLSAAENNQGDITPINQFNPVIIRDYNMNRNMSPPDISSISNIEHALVNPKPLKAKKEHKTNHRCYHQQQQQQLQQQRDSSSSSSKIHRTPRKILKQTAEENNNNNNVAASNKLNNLVLSENSFIFKNTSMHNYQHLFTAATSTCCVGAAAEATSVDEPGGLKYSSQTSLAFKDQTNNTITTDEDNDDEVFSNTNYCDKQILLINKRYFNENNNTDRKKKTSHGNITQSSSSSSSSSSGASKKRLNFSLSSASVILKFNSHQSVVDLINNKDVNNISNISSNSADNLSATNQTAINNTSSISMSSIPSKILSFNDQLVPREILFKKSK